MSDKSRSKNETNEFFVLHDAPALLDHGLRLELGLGLGLGLGLWLGFGSGSTTGFESSSRPYSNVLPQSVLCTDLAVSCCEAGAHCQLQYGKPISVYL